jgi:hypothetical protein
MSVHLHIDRLVLDGVALDRFEARRLQLALERLLASRFADPALLAWLRRAHGERSARDEAPRLPATVALRPVEAAAARIADSVAMHATQRGSARVAR